MFGRGLGRAALSLYVEKLYECRCYTAGIEVTGGSERATIVLHCKQCRSMGTPRAGKAPALYQGV